MLNYKTYNLSLKLIHNTFYMQNIQMYNNKLDLIISTRAITQYCQG